MGIDLYCTSAKTFGTSYSIWNTIRTHIIKATFDYIEDKFDKDLIQYGDLSEDHENWIGENSSYYNYKNILLELKTLVFPPSSNSHIYNQDVYNHVNKFIIAFCQVRQLDFLNALNYFGIGGLYALCNQSDCEGLYTPGNSLDICSLFDKIELFVKKYDTYQGIYNKESRIFDNCLYDVFQHSYNTKENVIIT